MSKPKTIETLQIPDSGYAIRYCPDHPDQWEIRYRNRDITAYAKRGPNAILIRDLIGYAIDSHRKDAEESERKSYEYL